MNPWSDFETIPCGVEACQCEAPRDAWIQQPSSFWSSLSYIIVAILFFNVVKIRAFQFKLWTLVCALVGFSSLIAHGSFTRLGLAIDFSSIILVLSFFVALNLGEKLKFTPTQMLLGFSSYYAALFVMMYSLGKWYKIGLCVFIFIVSVVDIIKRMKGSLVKEKMLLVSMLILVFSSVFFLVDEFHLGCDPSSLFQWHSVWHCGTAASLFFYGMWRFPSTVPGKG